MIAVIIAGGSGTRLWPLSTPSYPKHLLKINGDDHSLLQNAYVRAKLLTDTVYVISESGHIMHVMGQLSELSENNFIVEPARRGTAGCILAALVHIARRHDRDEPIVFLPADHYIRDKEGFLHSFTIAARIAQTQQRIVLVGIEPDYPATGFGYIKKGDLLKSTEHIYGVDSFKEKPDLATAKMYLRSGSYLWNAGYFIGTLDTFELTMRSSAPELAASFEDLLNTNVTTFEKQYLDLAADSIDYALIEKVKNLLVVPASFDWMDLGSFADLHKAVEKDERENYTSGMVEIEDVANTFIQNDEAKPIAVIGLDNIVVVNTPQGILVARKDLSQQVGNVSKRLYS